MAIEQLPGQGQRSFDASMYSQTVPDPFPALPRAAQRVAATLGEAIQKSEATQTGEATQADEPTAPDGSTPDHATQDHAAQDDATRWALAARGGDPVAAAAFVRATQAEVWRFTASLVDPGVADDLTQDTYLRAFRALSAFEGRASARTWLLGIARRACADHLRGVIRQRRVAARAARVGDAEPSSEDPAAAVGAAQLLGRLSTGQREAFVLTQVLGLSYEEAAQSLEVPIGTIRSRVARARAELVRVVCAASAV